MKKHTALFLLLVMAFAAFAGCADAKPGNEGTPALTSSPGGETEETAEGEKKPNIPDGLTYNGSAFNIYDGGNMSVIMDFTVEEDAGDVVNAARFKWITAAEDRFDIDITVESEVVAFGFAGDGLGYKRLATLYTAGDTTYDAVMINVYDMATAASSGYLSNLNKYPYIDLTQDWWDQQVNKNLSFYGCVYFTTGEISLSDNHATHCIVFNKKMADTMGINPYDDVSQNNWVITTFIEQIKRVSEDLDGDDKMGAGDRYGLMTWDDSAYGLLASIGEATVSPNDNGDLTLTFFTERVTNTFEQYRSIYFSQYVYNFYRVTTGSTYAIGLFSNNQMLYYMTKFNAVANMRDTEVDYGILPFPKYNAEQENYGHVVAAYDAKFIGVPIRVDNEEYSGAVLEYLAWTGQKVMTPAYYERTLIGTYIRDDESAEMLDIIYSSHVYDVGLYLNVGGIRDVLKNLANTPSFASIATIKAAREKSYLSALEKLNADFARLAGDLG